MLKEPFIKAKRIFDTFHENGFECYFVGGAVRDYLSNRSIGDIDIATNARPEDMQQIFPKTVPVGIEHGTVLILDRGNAFEVTTYRTEGDYEDFRHPNYVSFVDNITLDLSRRDFTMNAIAMDFKGQIIDPFNGKSDLENGIIRTVRHPVDRFNEDPLRMLRGVRFVSQLNFEMESSVKQAIKNQHDLLANISVERVADELIKLFINPYINLALHTIEETNIDQSLPIFKQNQKLFNRLKQLEFSDSLGHAGMIFAIFHLLQPDIKIQEWVRSYKLSNNIKNKALHLVNCYNAYKDEGLSNTVLYKIRQNELTNLVQLINLLEKRHLSIKTINDQYQQLPIHSRNQLVVSGQDLINWFPGKRKGKWVGDYLNRIEELVVENKLPNKKHTIESMVKQWQEHVND